MRYVFGLSISMSCLMLSLSAANGQSASGTNPPLPAAGYAQPLPAAGYAQPNPQAYRPPSASPYAQPYAPQYAPHPLLQSAPTALANKGDAIDHMRKAVKHLEAAGLTDEAAEIRRRVELKVKEQAQNQAILAKKLAQLKSLEAEVRQLRRSAAAPQQVMVDVNVFEVSTDKLKSLGVDLTGIVAHGCCAGSLTAEAETKCCKGPCPDCPTKSCMSGKTMAVIEDKKAFDKLVSALQTLNIARSLSRPKLITVSGRLASIQVGEQVAAYKTANSSVSVKPLVGLSINLVPIVLGDGKVRLGVRARHVKRFDGSQRLRVREVDTTVDVKSGQTIILRAAGKLQECAAKDSDGKTTIEQSEVFLTFTPVVVSTVTATPVPPRPAPYVPGRPGREARTPRPAVR